MRVPMLVSSACARSSVAPAARRPNIASETASSRARSAGPKTSGIVDRKTELRGHDAHDRVYITAQPDAPADDVRIRREAPLPLVECDHDDARVAALVFVEQRPPQH